MLTYSFGLNRARYAVFCLLTATSLPSCGGQVEEDNPTSSERQLTTGDLSDKEAPLPAEASSPDEDSEPDDSSLELPEDCVLGFVRSKDPTRCIYQFEDYCYEEKLLACACACPRHRDSVCVSGFPGPPGVPTQVSCN